MKIIVFVFFLLLHIAARCQTCIVIYVSSKGIVAGADRLYHQTINGAGHTRYFGKKIFTGGGCAWAMSGADYHDVIHAVCKKLSRGGGTLQSMHLRFEKAMQEETTGKAMQHLLLNSNEEQKKRFKANLAEIAFFKREGNLYKAYRITVSMPGVFTNSDKLQFETDSIVAAKNTVGIFVLGHYSAFTADQHPEKWVNPAATIRSLIKRQSRATPNDVSPQSDILQISKAGISWVSEK